MKTPVSILALICIGALASCVPKAIPVATEWIKETSPVKKSARSVVSLDLPAAETPSNPGSNTAAGLRRPDMLTLPEEGDLHGTNTPEKSQRGGAVNVRPPTEPPSRPKPPGE